MKNGFKQLSLSQNELSPHLPPEQVALDFKTGKHIHLTGGA